MPDTIKVLFTYGNHQETKEFNANAKTAEIQRQYDAWAEDKEIIKGWTKYASIERGKHAS